MESLSLMLKPSSCIMLMFSRVPHPFDFLVCQTQCFQLHAGIFAGAGNKQ